MIALWAAAWLVGLYAAARVALWLLRTVVGATGKAWRGD